MSIQLDRDYASRLAPYVRNFTRTPNGFRMSCPICGDSATNRQKARGHLYASSKGLSYSCFNCNTPIFKMEDLLESVDNNLAEQYRVDRFLEFQNSKPAAVSAVKQPQFVNQIDDELLKVSSLPDFHAAKQYVLDRQIPSDKHYLLYYVRNFKQFANRIDPSAYEHFDPRYMEDEPRLIIPLVTSGQNVSGYQGRAMTQTDGPKYLTILPHPDNSRMFGLDRADVNYKVRVFEGPIDALFIQNSVATCGGRLDTALPEAGISRDRCVVVYDNEPRNPETIKKIEKAIRNKFPVCIWPESMRYSDINKMIEGGYTSQQLEDLIDQRTFKGLNAELELATWRKI